MREGQASQQRSIFEDKTMKFRRTQEKIFEKRRKEDTEQVVEALQKIEHKLERGFEIRDELNRNRLRHLSAHSQRVRCVDSELQTKMTR